MSERQLRKEDLEALIGFKLHIKVYNGLELHHAAEGVAAAVGYGAFGGLFVEFDDGERSIGWNPEQWATITIVTTPHR